MFLIQFLFLTASAVFIHNSNSSSSRSLILANTHIHAIPPAYANALTTAGGDPSGYPTPNWSIEGTIESLALVGSRHGVLSISTPGVPIAGTGQAARKLCRELNIYLSNLTNSYPETISFFGALPDWRDVDGTMAEIDFLFSTQKKASGIGFYTSYGNLLPGNPAFKPIWEKLESYRALAFLHPGLMDVNPRFIDGHLPQPIIDYPQATTRAAVDLVFSGVVSNTPNVDIILSHAGGTLPYIAERAWGSLLIPSIRNESHVDSITAMAQFRNFYYDIALSASSTQLNGLLQNTDPSHVLMGTDYPYAESTLINANNAEFLEFAATHPEISPAVLSENAKALITKHAPSA
jgi:predicted TIM-barrel fold metal-dependent hydrolase